MLCQLYFLSVLIVYTEGASDSDMRQLLDSLLNSTQYSSRVRPIKDTGNVLTVTVDMYLIGLNDVDEVEQKIQTTAYLKITWTDYFLSWTPASYNNIDKITVKQDRVWKPDLALANAYDTISGLGDSFMYLTITYQGEITWYPYQVFDSSCTLDMTYFPFDSQSCDIQLVTWSSTKEMINIVAGTDGLDTSYYETNANWDLLGVSKSDSSTSTTAGLSFTLKLRRKPFFFLLNFIIPIVCLSILNLFVFVLPCDSGEKTSYAIVLFLSFAIFLLIVTEIMPEGMKTVPVMSTYLLIECVMSTIIVFVTIIQLRLHNQDGGTSVPHFLKSFVGVVFVVKRKLCLDKNYEEEARKREEELEKETSFQVVASNRGEKFTSDATVLPVLPAPESHPKPAYFSRKTRVTPDKDFNSGSSSSNSYPTDDIELEEADSSRMDKQLIVSKRAGNTKLKDNQNARTAYKTSKDMKQGIQEASNSKLNRHLNTNGQTGHYAAAAAENRIRLHQTGRLEGNDTAACGKPDYKFDNDSTNVKRPYHLDDDGDDDSSIVTLKDDDCSWADVATAMDIIFFIIFFASNLVTTLIAFLLSALGGNSALN